MIYLSRLLGALGLFLLPAFTSSFPQTVGIATTYSPKSSLRTGRTLPLMPASLQQYAPDAASLFGNMITPASILAGGLVTMTFASGLPFKPNKHESKFATLLRHSFAFVSVATFASHLIAIMWAVVVRNQLIETKVEMAESVWHLLQRDYELEWAAVNVHFVIGMLGFMYVMGTKAFFMANQGKAGLSAAGLAISGLTMMISIVNRGVASGGAEAGRRYGKSILALCSSYVTLLFERSIKSFGPLEWTAVTLAFVSTLNYVKFVLDEVKGVVKND